MTKWELLGDEVEVAQWYIGSYPVMTWKRPLTKWELLGDEWEAGQQRAGDDLAAGRGHP